MPKDQKRRQQKLVKQRRKQKEKRKRIHRAAGSADRELSVLRSARQYPIIECVINEEWREGGVAQIAVVRRQPNDLLTVGVYLVDLYCLGLKDTVAHVDMPASRYATDFKEHLGASGEAVVVCDTSLAHEIIYGAIDYAAAIGFKPHEDFASSQRILEPREAVTFSHPIEFGKDGKPLYIGGPHDKVNKILNHLEQRLGKDNFHFIVGAGAFEEEDDEE